MTNEAKFWDRIANRYAGKPVPDQAAYEKKLEITRGYLTRQSDVLEFGCGTGSTAIAHSPYTNHIRAIDFSAGMIEIAEKKRLCENISNVSFECASLEDLADDQGRYDVILGMSILHLLENWQEALAQVHRMLKPGGVFISSTACIGDSMAWFKYLIPVGRALRLLPQVVVFTTAELERAHTECAFELEHTWHPGKNRGVFIVARRQSLHPT